ncbi:hypothetical protein FSP39_003284 [Pinctada imbricata]|uniref:Uncharacterized protein n=1 Tax=Pinctada imbricata TaxID=66713 RepID=A0AA89C0M2_PINIB|nr:hypothetical protein FSP39_003284 [Pinctada imbricata]
MGRTLRETILNKAAPTIPLTIPPAETELPINLGEPSRMEIRKAIKKLKNGKAAGLDVIPAEAIKADIDTAVDILHSLFIKIWKEE